MLQLILMLYTYTQVAFICGEIINNNILMNIFFIIPVRAIRLLYNRPFWQQCEALAVLLFPWSRFLVERSPPCRVPVASPPPMA